MRAPEAVDPGEAVTLVLDAPAGPGTVLLLRRHGEAAAPLSRWALPPGTATHSFAAPRRAGSYRLVLERGGRGVDDAVLEVVAAPAALELRAPAEAGAPLSIHVSGSADRGDRIELVDRHGAVLAQVRLGALEAGSARLRAPGASGHYRLVLRDGRSGAALVETGFALDVPRHAWIRAPGVVAPEETVTVEAHGPAGPGFAVQLLARGDGRLLAERALGTEPGRRATVRLPAPRRPGGYLLRYLNRETGEVLSESALTVRRL